MLTPTAVSTGAGLAGRRLPVTNQLVLMPLFSSAVADAASMGSEPGLLSGAAVEQAFALLTVPSAIAVVVGLTFLARLASWYSSPRAESYAPIPVADDGDSDMAATADAAASDLEAADSSAIGGTLSGSEGLSWVTKIGTVNAFLRYASTIISAGTLGLSLALLLLATSRNDLIALAINVASQVIMFACFAFVALLADQPTAPSFLIGSVVYTASWTFCFAAMANDARTPAPHIVSWSITPEVTASLMSLLTFSWMSSIISKGNQTPLTMEALWQLRETDTAKEAFGRFQKYQ
ncbi:hypothetical protein HK405_008168 [Cladochytrium tenue]|nr:hypothetical protein HK405_008168 [Cladochytrium tenue]